MRSLARAIASRYIPRTGKMRRYGSLRRTLMFGFQLRSRTGSIAGRSSVRWAFQKSTKELSTSCTTRPLTPTCVSRQPAAYSEPML